MLTTDCVQKLLTEARYLDTKPQEAHWMMVWCERKSSSPCGTVSCAVGDMVLRGDLPAHRSFEGYPSDSNMSCIAQSLAISRREASFLFSAIFARNKFVSRTSRDKETPAQTAARIRKFVYYKLRKAEIFEAYEEARRREGNWNVAQQVLETVATDAAE